MSLVRMLSLALALAAVPSLSVAAPGSPGQPARPNSGASAFQEAATDCTLTAIAAGAQDPVAVAQQCLDAVELIWAAAYGQGPCLPWFE